MTISVIRDAILQRTSASNTPTLRNGQIVQGEILKIYPNNKAEIQIGSNKMIAEITTPLSVGRKYFFQVQATDQLIQLKVLGDHLRQESSQNTLTLMNQLAIKATRNNTQFITMLINEKIPFNHEQLQQALQIIEKSSNKKEAMSVLKEMLTNRLPITNNVFQALSSNQSNTISPLLNQLRTELAQLPQLNEAQQRLLQALDNITVRPLSTEHHVANQLINDRVNSEQLLNVLKVAGLIKSSVNISNLTSRLDQLMQTDSKNELSLQSILNYVTGNESRSNNSQITTNQQVETLKQTFAQLTNAEHTIQTTARKIMSIFHPLQTNSLSNEQFVTFRNMVVDQLFPQLPEATKEVLLPLVQQSRPENQAQIYHVLQTLANNETYKLSQNFVRLEASDSTFLNQPVQKQFLSHVNQYFQSIGIADEHVLKAQVTNVLEHGNIHQDTRQADTVKSLLIQMIGQDSTMSGERSQQMVHFINGMQLQSVQESNNFIHAALQIPGGKLGLNEDIYMQFEGKKTADEMIDPDFCRILFVLHLQNLQETIIDMHVQKRIVSVTIYNELNDGTDNITGLQKMLNENLQELDYHLSSVKFKPLHEQNKEETTQRKMERDSDEHKERFDFLV